jgi:hypothetical protein
MTNVRFWLIGAALLLCAGAVWAANPDMAVHNPDTDRIFWFIQSGDVDIGRDSDLPADNLDWLLATAVPTIQPEFVVLCGNLVDGTNGNENPTPPFQEEWDQYNSILDGHDVDAGWFFDLPGSREAWNDPGFSMYVANSVQGRATGTYHFAWSREFDWGSYLFVAPTTASADGPAYPNQPAQFPQDEADWLAQYTDQATNARLVFVFGHNPLQTYLPWPGMHRLALWVGENKASGYGFGHYPLADEDEGSIFQGGLLSHNGGGLGFDGECQYSVWVVDHDGVSLACAKKGAFPIIISQPLDDALGGGNEYAYPLALGAPSIHVRALAFSPDPPKTLNAEIEGTGIEFKLARIDDGPIYQGEFSAEGLAEAAYTITVSGSGLKSHTIQVRLATVACLDGIDNDQDGLIDYPDDPGCASYSDSTEWDDAPPVADAGDDFTVEVGAKAIFDGSGTYDADYQEYLTYLWRIEGNDGETFEYPGAMATYIFNEPGTYHGTLTVRDFMQYSSSDDVTVTVVPAQEDDDTSAEPEHASANDEDETKYEWGCGL